MKRSLGTSILVVATAVAAVSVVVGILIIGSPSEGRLNALDSGRVADLQGIMGATDLFWSRNERLPRDLAELAADPRTTLNTVDPGASEPYSYRIVDVDTYELCAIFDRDSATLPGRPLADFWRHGSGLHCFELEVDKAVR